MTQFWQMWRHRAGGIQSSPWQRGDLHTGPDLRPGHRGRPVLQTCRIRSCVPNLWQNDAKTRVTDRDGCSRWNWDPMALQMDPLGCPPSLGAQSGSDFAENNNTEVSATNPDPLRSTKGTERSI